MALLYTFRGIANRDLTPQVALRIGLVEGARLREEGWNRILMAGDHRVSTSMLKSALTAGLLSAGLDVVDLGMIPSPTAAFWVKREGVPGVMVTASHNPPEWNGFQFMEADSHIYGPDQENTIKAVIENDPSYPSWEVLGAVHRREEGAIEGHIGAIVERIRPGRRLKVIADVGGGMGVLGISPLLRQLGAEAEILHGALDPLFRGRAPEPRAETLGELCDRVLSAGADVGFAYDGDCDRLVVVDHRGRIVEGDRVVLLLCRRLSPGPVVLNASVSRITEAALTEQGFGLFRVRWGQTFMGRSVRDHGAMFGGEPDGHYTFPTFSLRGDAIAATAFFYELLSQTEESLSAILDALPASVIRNEKIEWDRDLAEFREEMLVLGEAFDHVEVLHERLFVMTTDHSKLSVRQSPFDGTLRIFAEGCDEGVVDRMIGDVKRILVL